MKKRSHTTKKYKENRRCKSVLYIINPSLLPFILKEKINLVTIILEKKTLFNYFTHTKRKELIQGRLLKSM